MLLVKVHAFQMEYYAMDQLNVASIWKKHHIIDQLQWMEYANVWMDIMSLQMEARLVWHVMSLANGAMDQELTIVQNALVM